MERSDHALVSQQLLQPDAQHWWVFLGALPLGLLCCCFPAAALGGHPGLQSQPLEWPCHLDSLLVQQPYRWAQAEAAPSGMAVVGVYSISQLNSPHLVSLPKLFSWDSLPAFVE